MTFDESRAIPDPIPLRKWVDMKTVQAHLGRSKNTITTYINAGMPAHRAVTGGPYLFDLAEVDRWIDSRWSRSTQGRPA